MDPDFFTILAAGAVMGLSAGFSPGPLFALLFSETLNRGLKAGLQISVAPLLTDAPIILICLLGFSILHAASSLLANLTAGGALYLTYLGITSLRLKKIEPTPSAATHHPLLRGVLINATNPHPYLFWLTVGTPFLLRSAQQSSLHAAGFLFGFYFSLVGSKAGLATALARFRHRLPQTTLLWINRALGLLLIGFAVLLLHKAWQLGCRPTPVTG